MCDTKVCLNKRRTPSDCLSIQAPSRLNLQLDRRQITYKEMSVTKNLNRELGAHLEYDADLQQVTLIESSNPSVIEALRKELLQMFNGAAPAPLNVMNSVRVDYDIEKPIVELFKNQAGGSREERIQCIAAFIVHTLQYESAPVETFDPSQHARIFHSCAKQYEKLLMSSVASEKATLSRFHHDPTQMNSSDIAVASLMLIDLSNYVNGALGMALQRVIPEERLYLMVAFDTNGCVSNESTQAVSICKFTPTTSTLTNTTSPIWFRSCSFS